MPPPNKRITSNLKGAPRRGRGVTAAATMTKWMLTFVLLGVFVATASAVDEIKSTETKTVQPSPSPSSPVVSSSSGTPRDEIYIDDESIEGSGGRGEIHDDLEKEPDYSGSGFGPDDEDSSTTNIHTNTHNSGTSSSNSNNNGNINNNNNNNNNDINSRINYNSNSNNGIIGSSNSNSNSASSSNSGINSIGKDILPSATSNTTTQTITASTSTSTSKSDILPGGSSDFDFGGGVVGSGDGRDTDDEDDDEDDIGSIGSAGHPDDDDDEDDEDEDDYDNGSEDVNTDKNTDRDGDDEIVDGDDDEYKTDIYTDVTDPSEGSDKTRPVDPEDNGVLNQPNIDEETEASPTSGTESQTPLKEWNWIDRVLCSARIFEWKNSPPCVLEDINSHENEDTKSELLIEAQRKLLEILNLPIDIFSQPEVKEKTSADIFFEELAKQVNEAQLSPDKLAELQIEVLQTFHRVVYNTQ